MSVIPGLVDAHTHPIWEGDRVHEFAAKLGGATYMDVHKMGGGIYFTVDHTKKADEHMLLESLMDRLKWMLKCGTTLVETKSGYGLDLENELKLLTVLTEAGKKQPVEMSITYCGGHAVPKGSTSEKAVEDIINVQIPEIKRRIDQGPCAGFFHGNIYIARNFLNDQHSYLKSLHVGSINVENIDVFCETGVFDTYQSKRILRAGMEIGLAVNFHGDELSSTGSAELGAELKSRAVSHLEFISENGMQMMADQATAAVILPTTAFTLRLKPPPVRRMLEVGVPVALGSDFNPNAHCYSMPIVMYLACVSMRISLEEALVASTINAAYSLGRGHSHGSLHVGRKADILILDAPKWEHLVYQFGCHEKLIRFVIKNGIIVYDRDRIC
uniref:Amidohydrolase 3 domain-containing protein n=1 Tax=Romanomermis culicivorax TaxID=13658 RepID=A0A915LAE0_ROMCU